MKSRFPSQKTKKSRFRFIGEIVEELRKAAWPTRQETLRLSFMVLIVCLILGIVLGAIDYGFTELSKIFLGGR